MRARMRTANLFGRTMFVLATAVALAVAATFLPDDPYERFQLLDSTIYYRARGYYERMHFDPKPVDVAIVGDSKAALGLKAEEMERRLAEDGKTAEVASFALEGSGRNIQWVFVQELLRTKHPKVLIVAVNDRPYPWGHDGFRYIAPAPEIWREAFSGLHDAKKNLVFLPFRQMRLSAALLFPSLMGVADHFDAAHYAAQPRDLPEKIVNQHGQLVDFSRVRPRADLLKEAAANEGHFNVRTRVPSQFAKVIDADDGVYTDLISREAARHGVKLLFVYMPAFHRPYPISNRDFYAANGRIQDDSDLADQDALFYDFAHFNSAGARIVSDRVADALATMLP